MRTMPGMEKVIDIDPLKPPELANGVAKCLDEFVLQNQTHEQLYNAIREEMQQYHMRNQAWQLAQARQGPPSMGQDAKGFEEFMKRLMTAKRGRGEQDQTKED